MDKKYLTNLEKKLKSIRIEGFVINQEGKPVFEYLKNKKVKEKPTKIYSVTKSIVSLLIGNLIDKGLIENIHTPIYHYFPEILKSKDPIKKEITLFHLLTMTSGLKVGAMQNAKNWVSYLLEQPAIHKPGTVFQYNSGDSHLLSAIITKVSNMTTAAFAEENLFKLLGVKTYTWMKDPQGIHIGGFSMLLNMEDMMKIGLLFLQNGRVGNKQVVSANWIEKSRQTYQVTELEENGSYGYGYQVWTYKSNHTENPLEFFYANGIFGQFIFIVPELKMVVVVKSQLQKEGQQTLPLKYFQELLSDIKTPNPATVK